MHTIRKQACPAAPVSNFLGERPTSVTNNVAFCAGGGTNDARLGHTDLEGSIPASCPFEDNHVLSCIATPDPSQISFGKRAGALELPEPLEATVVTHV
jgi:hypothetical protein